MNDWVRGGRERSIKNIEDCDLDICTIGENMLLLLQSQSKGKE